MSLKFYSVRMIGVSLAVLLLLQLLIPLSFIGAEGKETTSTIGGIEITAKKTSEIENVLAEAITAWKNQPIIVKGTASSIEIPTDLVHFDIRETVKSFKKESKAPWYMPWKERSLVHIPLHVEAREELDQWLVDNPFIRVDETHEVIVEQARYLKTSPVVAEEREVTKDMMVRKAFEIQPMPTSTTSMSALVAMLDGLILPAKESFSFIHHTEEITGSVDIESRRFFASVLYSVVLQADTSIIERHSQSKIRPYLQAGIEVDVSNRLQKDFAFRNQSNSPMLFNTRIEGENLIIELYMLEDAKDVTYSVLETKVAPKTIYRLSEKVGQNQQHIVEKGENGYRVTVHRTFDDGFGEEEEFVSKDFYPPLHQVIEVSTKEDIPADSNKNDAGQPDGNNANDTGHKDSRPNENNSSNDQAEDDDSDNPSNNHKDEVIYDKGGDILYDPNA